ncbi:MAG: hypothetical protein CM1200mP22_31470 [Dehalococcoidia bacterium]|nr:MAG: hypothetical protein CM1200mP22_31470 [Dehalococcoidia bacterium]
MSSHVKFGVRMHQHGYTFDELKRVWTQQTVCSTTLLPCTTY